jgi:hypothetical protein
MLSVVAAAYGETNNKTNALGADFEKQVKIEEEMIRIAREEYEATKVERKAAEVERFRNGIANRIAVMNSTGRDSICVQYERGVDIEPLVDDLVALGYYVTRWHYCDPQQTPDNPIPYDFIEIFRKGLHNPGSGRRSAIHNPASLCNLL